MTAKYGIPYFSNFINSDMSPDDARSMCCRLRLDNRELRRRGGGLFGANPLTGSIGVVTLNLPRIGHLSATEEEFFGRLQHLVTLAADSLAIKRKVLESFTEKNLYPYSRFYLGQIKARTGAYWKNHFSTIGIIGMNEACLNFLGQDLTTDVGQAFGLRVMTALRDQIAELQDRTGEIFNLEATPGEGTSYRLCMLDKHRYPQIICANEKQLSQGASPYYTNSSQLPVNYTSDLFETLRLQDDLQSQYTGGTVLHIFLGEQIQDIEALKRLVRKVATNYRLPYFTLTPTFSVCPQHGYRSGNHTQCEICTCQTEVSSGTVKYLHPIRQNPERRASESHPPVTFSVA